MTEFREEVNALREEVQRCAEEVRQLKDTVGALLQDMATTHDEQMATMNAKFESLALMVMELNARSLANEVQLQSVVDRDRSE